MESKFKIIPAIFRIDYGYSVFHLGGGLNHFGVSANMQEFKR